MQRRNSRRRDAALHRKQPIRGFSLLELIAVIVVIGLIASIGIVSVSGHLDRAQLMQVAQTIVDADRKERDRSRQSPTPGGLRIDGGKKRLRFSNSKKTINLEGKIKLAEFIVASGSDRKGTILYSQSGQSPTYAIRLETRRGASNWIVVIGISGQVIVTDKSQDVQSLFAMGGG